MRRIDYLIQSWLLPWVSKPKSQLGELAVSFQYCQWLTRTYFD